MVRLACVLVALGACSYTPPGPNTEVTPDGPADLDAPPIDMAPDPQPGDVDGDGIVDAEDSCPDDFDPNERDHDGDGIGDPCDRCPVVLDAADPDMDGDGVGDKCDPAPNTPGHQRVGPRSFRRPACDDQEEAKQADNHGKSVHRDAETECARPPVKVVFEN